LITVLPLFAYANFPAVNPQNILLSIVYYIILPFQLTQRWNSAKNKTW